MDSENLYENQLLKETNAARGLAVTIAGTIGLYYLLKRINYKIKGTFFIPTFLGFIPINIACNLKFINLDAVSRLTEFKRKRFDDNFKRNFS